MTRRPHLVARLSLAAAMSTVAVIAVAPWANADAPVTLGLATPVTYDPAITGPITNASVDAVSCSAPGDCAALGTFETPSSPDASFTMTSTNGVWSAAKQIFGANATVGVEAKSLSCSPGGNCFVVGSVHLSSTSTQAFVGIVGETPFIADFASSPLANAPFSEFTSISCTAKNNCAAVGDALDAQGVRTAFAESITSSTQSPGGQQNPVVAPVYATNVTPYSPASAKFNSVSCSTPGDCTAVGDYTNAANDETAMSAVEANGAWGAITPTVFAAGTQNSTPLSVLNSVSCAGPLDCTAVGIVMDPHTHMQPFSMTLTKGTWTRARVAVFARGAQDATPQAAYSSVSCTSPGNCTEVGAYNIGSSPSKKFQVVRGFADLQTNGTWATVTPSIFHHGIEASPYADYFISVSCAQASFCTATGQYEDAQGGIHPFLESSIGGVWRPAVVAKVASSIQYTTPDSAFAAVSCPQVGRCAAVGYYSNTSDSSQGLSEFTSGPPPSTVSASIPAAAVAIEILCTVNRSIPLPSLGIGVGAKSASRPVPAKAISVALAVSVCASSYFPDEGPLANRSE